MSGVAREQRATGIRQLPVGGDHEAARGDDDPRWDTLLGRAMGTFEGGSSNPWGVPIRLGEPGTRRWLAVDPGEQATLALDGPARSLVLAFCCGGVGEDDPSTHVALGRELRRLGEPVGHVRVALRGGGEIEHRLRRRIDIAPPAPRWFLPYGARSHREDEHLDRCGSIVLDEWPEYAIGARQSMFRGDYSLWLWPVSIPAGDEASEIVIAAEASTIALGAVTLVDEPEHPFALQRIDLHVSGAEGVEPHLDRGWVLGVEDCERPDPGPLALPAFVGFGGRSRASGSIVRLYAHPRARLTLGDTELALDALGDADGVEALAPVDRRVRVSFADPHGEAIAVRVHARAADGRYLLAEEHARRPPDGLLFDSGTDVIVGDRLYAYADGELELDAPAGTVVLEIWHGPQHAPALHAIEVGEDGERFTVTVERAFDFAAEGWVSADTHVHFLARGEARVHAHAEDLDLLHLLAIRWGEMSADALDDGAGRGVVRVGSENRHHMLGHLSVLDSTAVRPLSTGGPQESALGDPVEASLGDWAVAAREDGALAVLAHWPDPYLESAAALLLGLVDAVELWFTDGFPSGYPLAPVHDLDSFRVLEWYRYLDLGVRAPIVGGTDKMSARTVVGSLRTWADAGEGRGVDGWPDAVRAGRTVVSSGPLLELSVDGAGLGETVTGARRASCSWRVRSVLPVAALEIVVNSEVVRTVALDGSVLDQRGEVALDLPAGGWIAARCIGPDRIVQWQPEVPVAAHTSPIYLDGPPPGTDEDYERVEALLEGAAQWSATVADWRDDDVRARFDERTAAALRRLAELRRQATQANRHGEERR